MQTNVHFEAPRRGEALQAVLALERLDARVRFDVSGEGALHGEGPEALGTLEGLLMGVNADVAHQVARLPELLGAVGTHVPPHAILLADGTCSQGKITHSPALVPDTKAPKCPCRVRVGQHTVPTSSNTLLATAEDG